MKIDFTKYQGAGNDFIMIDGFEQPELAAALSHTQVEWMCNRYFGIGADGLIIMQPSEDYDFEMIYYNSNGHLSSMCGNGGRCILHFANAQGRIGAMGSFLAADGPHEGHVENIISLKMGDVAAVEQISEQAFFLDTGSPHYVHYLGRELEELKELDLVTEARNIRYNDRFQDVGTNVNFLCSTDDVIVLRTYERGVEDETLACGTGVVASAIAYNLLTMGKCEDRADYSTNVQAEGGVLSVRFSRENNVFTDIWLIGPAQAVFVGRIDLANYPS